MDNKRTTRWGLSRDQTALLGAIIVYGVLVVVVTPLLLGFLPILGIGWMLRVPVASSPADRAVPEIDAPAPLSPAPSPTEVAASSATTPVSSGWSASA